MNQHRSAVHWINLLGVAGFAVALAGCSGDDGAAGPAGPSAVVGGTTVNVSTLNANELKSLSFSRTESRVDGVTINSAPVVRFTLKDANGRGVTGLGFTSQSSPTATATLTNMAFALAKLVVPPEPTTVPSRWVSYMVVGTTGSLSRPGTDNAGTLVDHGNGSYTYTFFRDITGVAAIVAASADTAVNKKADLGDTTYEPNRTHRLTIQIGGNVRGTGSNTSTGVTVVPGVPMQNPINLFFDFIPATGQVVTSSDDSREIVNVSACFQCHGQFTWHGGDALDGTPGTRQDTRYCVVCHTDQRKFGRRDAETTATTIAPNATDAASGVTSTYRVNSEGYDANGTGETWGQSLGLMPRLIHRIHRGKNLYRTGYNYAGARFNEVTFPQEIHCRKCHIGIPDGENFKNVPNRAACGACHDNLNFATGVNTLRPNHDVQTNDSLCAGCHTPTAIEEKHQADNFTTNNPFPPAGALHLTYEIASVTTSVPAAGTHTQPVIKFRILSAASASVTGTAITLTCNLSSSNTANTLLAGFSGSPGFVVAFAMAQDGVTPAEYNNRGNAAAQPASVTIANICNGTQGSMSARDAEGYYTATITGATRGYPAGSTMRAVGLQGTFTQLAGTNGIAANTPRNVRSVVKAVAGDPVRRAIVDNDKCSNCHESLSLHGGSRVYETGLCVMCHNPNLSSSGRFANLANLSPAEAAELTADGYNAADPSTWPEMGMNFKNLIHQIHGSRKRSNEFRFVRDRGTSGVFYYNMSEVTFPGILRNCETCHKAGLAGGYDGALPAGALPTTNITVARASVPNNNDDVTLPFLATCVGCHDSTLAKAHMTANGGVFTQLGAAPGSTGSLGVSSQVRSVAVSAVEQCVLCHGPGRSAAVTEVHARR